MSQDKQNLFVALRKGDISIENARALSSNWHFKIEGAG